MKHVLITGASSGIGRASIDVLLNAGYYVWAGLRNPSILESLQKQNPDRLRVLKLDVTSEFNLISAFEKIRAAENITSFSIINNAGIATGGPVEALSIDEWRSVFEVNVFGVIRTSQIFLPLIRQTKGRVVNIGSISGRVASPFLAPYSATKFAVRAISDSLRREMKSFGVEVVLVEPGPIKTEIWEKSVSRADEIKSQMSADHLATYSESIDRLVEGVNQAAAGAVPVSHVTSIILEALETAHPKPYYLVGKGIRLTALLEKLLPTKALDNLILKGFASSKMKRGQQIADSR